MLRNYVKIALRTLWKRKGITAINVLGLAAGMAVCLLVGLLFWDQANHDDFHPGADRIYRVTTLMSDDDVPTASSPGPLASALREGVAGVETATRMHNFSRTLLRDNQAYNVEGLYTEPEFFELFGFELATGNAEQALAKPYTAVVTRDLARRLYGDEDPVGKTFQLQNGQSVTVTGVLDRSAYRSHLHFEVLVSGATLRQTQPNLHGDWYRGINETSTYLRIAKGQNPAVIEASLERLRRRHLTPSDEEGISAWKKRIQAERLQLEPLSAVPFSSVHPVVETGTLPGIMGAIPGGLAFLVLLAAGFNYVNLSTARSLTRGREVGVRKTMGAHRQQVMGEFIAETVIVALLALGGAVFLLQGLVPLYNQLSVVHQMELTIGIEPGLQFYGMAVLFAMGIGALAGLYPAWHLSSFQPAQVLKTGVQSKTPRFQWMTPRKGMIVLQFLIAFVVIVTGTVVYRQFEHMRSGEYPIHVDQVVRIELQESDFGPFQQRARRQAGVQQVGATSGVPVVDPSSWCRVESSSLKEAVRGNCYSMDYEAAQLLDLPIIMTDGFTEARFESGQAVLVTERGVRRFGFSSPPQALGQPVTLKVASDEERQVRIAGVVQNLPTYSEHAELLLFHNSPEQFKLALARVGPQQDSSALNRLQSTWDEVAKEPFKGDFVRSYVDKTFANALAEFGWALGLMAGLAVFISCLGLLGIVTYTVQTRTREIGIRKALGATVTSVVGLLSKDVLWLVGTAILLGMPIAWLINRQVLRNFPKPINFGLFTLILVAAAIMGFALLAVMPPTLRAARTDPAQTLRDE